MWSRLFGHDLYGPDIILYSGKDKFVKNDMRMFERSWSLTNFWGLMVLAPGTLAKTEDDLEHVAGIKGLEVLGKFSEAKKSYAAVLKNEQKAYRPQSEWGTYSLPPKILKGPSRLTIESEKRSA